MKTAYTANLTALSAATYFTLLAQGRLVDDAASMEMKTTLRGGCVTGLFPPLGAPASKCGVWSDYLHDCALIDRGSVAIRRRRAYKDETQRTFEYTELFNELDKLIGRNDQTPKRSCY